MIRRLRNSWIYRSAALYQWLSRSATWPIEAKPISDVRYLTMGGRLHLDMMVASLRSLAASWIELPRLRVVLADETETSEAEHRLRWWPGPFEVLPWKAVSAWAASGIGLSLAQFAEREPMGRKMAAVFHAANDGPVLYSDVDVLWFRNPPSLGGFLAEAGPFLAMSMDIRAAYDDRLVPARLPELASSPYFCAGMMFANGRIFDDARLDELLDFAARHGIGLSEQTLFAMLARSLGDRSFGEEEIYLSDVDRLAGSATFAGKPWAARHYVGQVRHLFWRDAYFLQRQLTVARRNRVDGALYR